MSKLVGAGVQASKMAKAIQDLQRSATATSAIRPTNPMAWQEWRNSQTGKLETWNPYTKKWEVNTTVPILRCIIITDNGQIFKYDSLGNVAPTNTTLSVQVFLDNTVVNTNSCSITWAGIKTGTGSSIIINASDINDTGVERVEVAYNGVIAKDEITLIDVTDGNNGADGQDGANGEDGANGADGTSGTDGANGLHALLAVITSINGFVFKTDTLGNRLYDNLTLGVSVFWGASEVLASDYSVVWSGIKAGTSDTIIINHSEVNGTGQIKATITSNGQTTIAEETILDIKDGAKGADGIDGVNGIDGINGINGNYTSYIFRRLGVSPTTPTGNSPTDWYDYPPSGTLILWMSKGVKNASGVLQGVWSTPIQLNGNNGTNGVNGTDGNSVFVEYSIDGSTLWHTVFTTGDKYMRQKIGISGTWTTAIKIVGENGINGANGVNGINGTSIIWQGEFATHPLNPQAGWAYRNTTDKKTYVYYTAWYVMTIDGLNGANGTNGINGINGTNGTNGTNGLSIIWKGETANPPINPIINWAYRDTDNNCVYIYNGLAWELMVIDGNDGIDGANGENGADGSNGLSVFITYHDNAVDIAPTTPIGDGTTNGWHTNSTMISNWMSQKVSESASTGTWGSPIRITGFDGGYTDYIFKRSTTLPTTPTGNIPIGWSDSPPVGIDPLWISKAGKTSGGTLQTTWSVPIKLNGDDGVNGQDGTNGNDGANGIDGIDGNSVFVEYSINGLTNWHDAFVSADKYMRQKTGVSGTWSIAIKIVGEDGINGANGTDGQDGTNGTNGQDGADGIDGIDGTTPVIASLDSYSAIVSTDVYGSNGDFTNIYTIARLFRGETEIDLATTDITLNSTSLTTGTLTKTGAGLGVKIPITAVNNDTSSLLITITTSLITGTYTQKFTVSKSKTGGGIVFQGDFNASKLYANNPLRKDIVQYDNGSGEEYWIFKGTNNTSGVFSTTNWQSLGNTFTAVATKLLLAEDANITKTLIIGSGTTLGLIKSANFVENISGWALTHDGNLKALSGKIGGWTITGNILQALDDGIIKGGQSDFAVGDGFFLGKSGGQYKFSVGTDNNYIRFDGQSLIIKGTLDLTAPFVNKKFTVAELPIPATIPNYYVPSANSSETVIQANLFVQGFYTNDVLSGLLGGNAEIKKTIKVGSSFYSVGFNYYAGQRKAFIIKHNANMGVDSSKTLTTNSGYHLFYDVCTDGTYLYAVGGADKEYAGSNACGMIIKFDTSLNIISSKFMGTISDMSIYTGCVYLGGYIYAVGICQTIDTPILIKLDTSMNVSLSKKLNSLYIWQDSETPAPKICTDNTYLYITLNYDYTAMLIKFNTSFTQQAYWLANSSYRFTSITSDGSNIYGVGYYWYSGSRVYGIIIKFTTSLVISASKFLGGIYPDGGTTFTTYAQGVAINNNKIYLTGNFTDSSVDNKARLFIAELDTSLTLLNKKLLESSSTSKAEYGQSITFDGNSIIVSGYENDTGTGTMIPLCLKISAFISGTFVFPTINNMLINGTNYTFTYGRLSLKDSNLRLADTGTISTGTSSTVSQSDYITTTSITITNYNDMLATLYELGFFKNISNLLSADNVYTTKTDTNVVSGNIKISLSKDNGANFSSVLTNTFTSTEETKLYGSASNVWGYTWTGANIKNNLVVKISTDDLTDYILLSNFAFTMSDSVILTGIEVSVEAKWVYPTMSIDQVKVRAYYGSSLIPIEAGSQAYATNGRKNGEAVGSGTGVLCFFDGLSRWIACDSGQTVLA